MTKAKTIWQGLLLCPVSLQDLSTSISTYGGEEKDKGEEGLETGSDGFLNFGSGRVRVLKKYFGSGRVGLGIGYLYQIPSQLGIMGYWNLDRVFAEYLPYFLYFLISIILFD